MLAIAAAPRRTAAPTATDGVDAQKQVAVLQLINAHRFLGHRQASLDPLNQYERPQVAELEPAFHDLNDADLDTEFNTGSLQGPDNILVFETERYRSHPLVIRGPGAGAEVTAAGVLGDILKTVRTT